MFLVIPVVEFLHVLGVDINVHHENPATFLCHVSISSVKQSRHRLPRLVGTRSSRLEPGRDTRHRLGSHLSLDGNDRMPLANRSGPMRDLVFISYSHRDKDWLERLLIFFKPY